MLWAAYVYGDADVYGKSVCVLSAIVLLWLASLAGRIIYTAFIKK